MKVDVLVSDQTVAIDGVGVWCPGLVAPEDWAWAYHWDDEAWRGVIEPNSWLGRDAESFTDPDRILFAINARKRARGEPVEPLPMPPSFPQILSRESFLENPF